MRRVSMGKANLGISSQIPTPLDHPCRGDFAMATLQVVSPIEGLRGFDRRCEPEHLWCVLSTGTRVEVS
jgi:hypothetical protein